MMKVTTLLFVLGYVCLASAAEKYTTKYDNIDLDEILNNQRLYKKYFDCLSSKGKCTPDGKELKEVLADAMTTDCKKCSEKQKAGSHKVINFVMSKKPADYETIEKLYDPTGIYKKKLQASKPTAV